MNKLYYDIYGNIITNDNQIEHFLILLNLDQLVLLV